MVTNREIESLRSDLQATAGKVDAIYSTVSRLEAHFEHIPNSAIVRDIAKEVVGNQFAVCSKENKVASPIWRIIILSAITIGAGAGAFFSVLGN